MIDFHCHVDLYPDALNLAKQINRRNTFTLAVTTSPKAWQLTSQYFASYKNIATALGFHPELVEKRISELPLMLMLISQTRYIGEIGIDGSSRYKDSLSLQTQAFASIIQECEKHPHRILSIHSRGATNLVLGLIEQEVHSSIPILHWFTGNQRELTIAKNLDCWYSINPSMLTTHSGCNLIRQMPLNRILLETDGPFTRCNGAVLYPWDTTKVINSLANLFDCSIDEITKQIEYNVGFLQRI